ncbi:hypothetical protein OU800_21955 [Pseudomonas sp. GOM7]|uniref:hypothetical protein n=1 Tax=Pseudomonas sp. GOM7 TaxID=2998079 RepID=UPI00227B20F6|nr:hypothetical protein [Pseudomonas sp. GOM7]WAJ37240.1 hypothetical protein OU800_21955 [Pseudomonas sp. GOM7]
MPVLLWTAPAIVVVASIYLGLLKENRFIEAGLAIVVIAATATILLSALNARKAAKAKNIDFESYVPENDSNKSSSFKFVSTLGGVDTRDPIGYLQKQIDEIKRVAIQDEKDFRSLFEFTSRRVDIALARLSYHEDVTLPRILGQGAGIIIVAGVLTIIGSIYLAFPDRSYEIFSTVGAKLTASFSSVRLLLSADG